MILRVIPNTFSRKQKLLIKQRTLKNDESITCVWWIHYLWLAGELLDTPEGGLKWKLPPNVSPHVSPTSNDNFPKCPLSACGVSNNSTDGRCFFCKNLDELETIIIIIIIIIIILSSSSPSSSFEIYQCCILRSLKKHLSHSHHWTIVTYLGKPWDELPSSKLTW